MATKVVFMHTTGAQVDHPPLLHVIGEFFRPLRALLRYLQKSFRVSSPLPELFFGLCFSTSVSHISLHVPIEKIVGFSLCNLSGYALVHHIQTTVPEN
jgi:hypothetical protein